MNTINRILGCVAATFVVWGTLWADAPGRTAVDDTRAYFEVMRSQFNANKVAVYNDVLKLTAAEADKFWPIYRDYERELSALADKKLELVRDFFMRQDAGKLTNEDAAVLSEKWLQNAQARLDLWKKYHKKISRAVSPTRAAQFLQMEHQIALFIDIGVASEMPAITPATNTGGSIK
jgi:hypothetical protein